MLQPCDDARAAAHGAQAGFAKWRDWQ